MESRFLENRLGKLKQIGSNYREGYNKTNIKDSQISSGWHVRFHNLQKLNPNLTCVMLHKWLHVPSNMRYFRCMQFKRAYSGILSQNGSTDINISRELSDEPAKEGDEPKQTNPTTKRKRSCRNLREKSHKRLYGLIF